MNMHNKKNGTDNAIVMVFCRDAKTHANVRIAAHFRRYLPSRNMAFHNC